jgi:lambda repressor-like predicted transcriptional regulator
MQYPRDFSSQAQARVEAAEIRAAKDFMDAKNALPRRGMYGSPAEVERLLKGYILTVFGAFAHGACELGRQLTWTVARIDSEVHEFLRLLVLRACREKGYDTMGRPFSMGMIESGGGMTREAEREFKESVAWSKYQDERLEVADIQASAKNTDVAVPSTDNPTNEEGASLSVSKKAEVRRALVLPRLQELGMTASKWATTAGVHPSIVYDFLAGKSNPRPDTRNVLADAIGMKVSDLPR